MDLFTVSEDGAELTVNAKWLQHLQERLLGDDGHPRKARCGRHAVLHCPRPCSMRCTTVRGLFSSPGVQLKPATNCKPLPIGVRDSS